MTSRLYSHGRLFSTMGRQDPRRSAKLTLKHRRREHSTLIGHVANVLTRASSDRVTKKLVSVFPRQAEST